MSEMEMLETMSKPQLIELLKMRGASGRLVLKLSEAVGSLECGGILFHTFGAF